MNTVNNQNRSSNAFNVLNYSADERTALINNNDNDDDSKSLMHEGGLGQQARAREKNFLFFFNHKNSFSNYSKIMLSSLVACLLFFSGTIVGSKSSSYTGTLSTARSTQRQNAKLGFATISQAPNKDNNNNNNNNNNVNVNNDQQQSGNVGSAEEDAAYQSFMDMFGLFSQQAVFTREALEEPEPVLSLENQDLLKQEKGHEFSKVGRDMGYFRAPSIRNDTLVFVSEGSIWLSHITGGPAARISSSYSYESVPKLSPDGRRIAFLAESQDGFEVFELPIAGGVARQVTQGAQAYGLSQWADNNELLILTTQFSDLGMPQLAKVDALSGKVSVLPFQRAHGGTKDPFGCYLFYPLRQSSSTKRYEGGEQARIWRWCDENAIGVNQTWSEARELTPESWSMRGAWSPQTSKLFAGKVFFISDKEGVANLWVMNSDGSSKTRLTFECEYDVMEYSIDGNRIVMRVGADLKSVTVSATSQAGGIALSEAKVLSINLLSEFREAQSMIIPDPLWEISELSISDDGVYGAFVVRGQIYFSPLIAQLGTRIEKVTKYEGMVRYKHLQFIPNSHPGDPIKLLALSDAGGEYDYVVLERDMDNGVSYWKETQVTQAGAIQGGLSYSQISPDGTSLAFDDSNGHVKLVNFTNTVVNTEEFRTPASPKDDEGNFGGGSLGEDEDYSSSQQQSSLLQSNIGNNADGSSADVVIDIASFLIKRQQVLDKRTKKIQAARKFVKVDMHAPNFRSRGDSSSSTSGGASLGAAQQQQKQQKQMSKLMSGAAKLSSSSKSNDNQADVREIVSGLQPESAGEYAWSPDGTWLAYVALFQDTDFEVIYAWNTKTNERLRITPPSSNSRSPTFSPDGLFLYYFNDAQFSSGSNSPYGSRGSEPVYEDGEGLYCLPLREGLSCPFFSGDEMNAAGTIFDPTLGQKYPTKISMKNIEKRAILVPFVDRARYESMHIIGTGATILLNMYDSQGSYLIAVDIMQGYVTPIYPDAYEVLVSRDLQVVVLFTEEGVALMSAQTISETPDQDAILSQALLWLPPETWTVTVNPREEWMQMYDEAMRTMRDNFYDPNLHGVDWVAVTERYRPLVKRLTSKNELRDVLEQALGELSVLHVFVDVEAGEAFEKVGMGASSACLGAEFKMVQQGLRIQKIYDTSEVLMAPNSPLSAMAVDLRAGDIITRIDGVLVNTMDDPLPRLLMGKAYSQVLLEVIRGPRTEQEIKELEELQDMIASVQQSNANLGSRMMSAQLGQSPKASSSSMSRSTTKNNANLHQQKRSSAITKGGDSAPQQVPQREDGEQFFTSAQNLNSFNPLLDITRLALQSNRLGMHSKSSSSESSDNNNNNNNNNNKNKNSAKVGEEEQTQILDRVVVVPLDVGTCSALQKADALNARKAKVRKDSNDTIGYVYLEDMVQEGPETHSMDDFASQFYPNLRKGGLIIDVRRNHGGNIDTWVLERLRRMAWMFESHRSGPGETTMQYSFRGKVVVLIDEMSSSDAELFAAGFQTMKLGKVIGARSWGGAVGYSGNPEMSLVDGSSFTIPSFGPYLGNEWLIEQKGVIPDIKVDNLPVETFYGRDKQLDEAIKEVLKEISESPSVKIPEHPQFPLRAYDNAKCLLDQQKKVNDDDEL